MIAILKGFIFVGGVGFASVLLFHRAADRQVDAASRRCNCTCALIADYPDDYTQRDAALALVPGETAKLAWGGGMVVCLRRDEPNPAGRFAALRGVHERRLATRP
jgi:hypothetical protein